MMFRFNGVSERDMDLLFLEEFAVNKDFRDLFIQQIQDFDLNGHEIVSEELSFVDAALGESDLTIVLENKGHKVALLIEDKIMPLHSPDSTSDMWNVVIRAFWKKLTINFMSF